MNKVPFSPVGFKELEAGLYALPEAELLAEANAVGDDYISWAITHVDLSPAQHNFLYTFDPNFVRHLGSKARIVIANRLPMELILPDNYKEKDRVRGSKWFLDHTSLEIYDNTVEPPLATGTLIYEIQFT
ncbi:hypothetical protein D3C71_89310 [compost metagenome]